MARYGDILEVLKDEIRLIRRTKRAAARSSLLVESFGPMVMGPDGAWVSGRNECAGLPAPLPPSDPPMARVLVGDTGDLLELIADQPEFGEVTEICAHNVARQIENRERAA